MVKTPIRPSLHFGLTQLDEKLVIVGGDVDELTPIKDVYSFEEDSQKWNNLPSLSEARCFPCAFTHKSVVVAAGGINRWKFDYDIQLVLIVWKCSKTHSGFLLCLCHLHSVPCRAIVNDTSYIIGGSKPGRLPN